MRVRVGIGQRPGSVDPGLPQWVEIDGVRLDPRSAAILKVEHHVEAGAAPSVVITAYAHSYEVVDAEEPVEGSQP